MNANDTKVNFVCFNCNILRLAHNRKHVFNNLKKSNALVFLQESHMIKEMRKYMRKNGMA